MLLPPENFDRTDSFFRAARKPVGQILLDFREFGKVGFVDNFFDHGSFQWRK
jgi:hypothetical protein